MARPTNRPKLKTVNLMVRTSPRLKFAIELIARRQGKSYAQVVEWAIENLIADPRAQLMMSRHSDEAPVNVLDKVWDADEVQRFINLAETFPGLLSPEEQSIWYEINTRQQDFFHREEAQVDDELQHPRYTYVDVSKVRRQWELLQERARTSADSRD